MFHVRSLFALLLMVFTVSQLPSRICAEEPTTAAPTEHSKQHVNARGVPKLDPVPPPTKEELESAITRGVDFLLEDQNKQGWWGSATRTKDLNIYAPIPGSHHGFKAAVTAMSISALIESKDNRPEVAAAIERAETWMLENLVHVRRANEDAIYNVWAHGYAVEALVRMQKRHKKDTAMLDRIGEVMKQQFEMLEKYESVDGGWGYYDMRYQTKKPSSDSISFTNAAILVAMHDAKEAGYEPPQKIVDRAIAATQRQKLPDGSYLYGEYLKWMPRRGINRPGGSLGRSQACNLALYLWQDESITQETFEDWLDRLFARNGWLDIGRKRPVPHESWMQVAGYFYYFGHYYGARCIDQLPVEMRPEYQAHMARTILPKQEKDGSWWDFPFYDYHQPYGTSFAIMTLVRCREKSE